jgi:hypothetical protein
MCKNWNKFLLGTIIITVLFLFLPSFLKAEGNESESRKDTKDKDKNIVLHLTPLENHSLISFESIQFIETGDNPQKIKLYFSPKKIDSQLKTRKFSPIKYNDSQCPFYTTSLITLTCLNIADYYTTVKALKYEHLKESNPVMRPFTKNTFLYSTVKLGLTVYNYYFLKKLYQSNKKLAWAVSIVANFALTYVVASNIRMIDEAQNN